MIIQIDHIAISTCYFDKAVACTEKYGYNLRFIERDVKNLGIKQNFLHSLNPTHDIAFLQLENSYPIEIINHHSRQDINSYILPVIPGGQAVSRKNQPISQKLLNLLGSPGTWSCLDIPVFSTTTRHSSDNSISMIVAKTNDLKKSVEFWGYMGFKLKQIEVMAAEMSFISPFHKFPLELIVTKTPEEKSRYALDSAGVSCIALISTSSKRDRDTLKEKGVPVTEIGALNLNGKSLNIFFAMGPCNEIVEIIEITH